MSANLSEAVKGRARELGFGLVGIARAESSRHMSFYRSWLEQGRHGEMGYLARPDAVARREDLRRTLPSVRTVVVVGHEYSTEDPEGIPADPSRAVVARYARGRDYHGVIRKRLEDLHGWISDQVGWPIVGRSYVDTGPILERELASRAGLGWFGKNTMLIHPKRGSYFFLGALLLDLELTPDEPFQADHCGTCRKCLDACPTGALLGRTEQGAPVMDARRCISYLTIELRGPIPRELRPLMGNRVFGCDICQECCPFNNDRFVQITTERDYRADWREAEDRPDVPEDLPGTEAPSLVDLMKMTGEEWDLWTRGSAIRRAGYPGLKRNVAVAMGNWLASVDEPPEEAVAALREALEDEEPLVREHAVRALERASRS